MNLNRKTHNGENGTSTYRAAVSPGKEPYEQKVASNLHQVTAAKIKPKTTQKFSTFLKLQIDTFYIRSAWKYKTRIEQFEQRYTWNLLNKIDWKRAVFLR